MRGAEKMTLSVDFCGEFDGDGEADTGSKK